MAFFEKSRREGKKKQLDDYVLDFVDIEAFEKIKSKVNRLESELENIKVALESAAKSNQELAKELNKRDVTIDQMAAEITSLKNTSKEMGESVINQEQEIKKCKQDADLISKAGSIVEKKQDIEEKIEQANEIVSACKDEINTTYAKVLKEKEDLAKNKQKTGEINIQREVKDVIRQNARFVKHTVDMQKSVVFFGVEEDNIVSKIDRDKVELSKVVDLLKVISEENEEIGIEEFTRLGKYVENVNRPLKVTLQCSNMVEMIMKNARNLKQSDQWKHVWVNRCLSKEDRDKLRERVQEAKQKNSERSEEEEAHFFFKVIGMQVKKVWRTRASRD